MTIVHTSSEASGQIYVPEVNTILMVACVALTLMFQKSGNLAAAYGIAVMGTMVITTVLLFSVERRIWHWPLWKALAVCGVFMVVDIPFLLANVVKIVSGGWVPLVVAFVDLQPDDDLEARPDSRAQAPRGGQPAARLFSYPAGGQPALSRAGDCGLHDFDDGRDAADPAAPFQAQQGAAREGHSASPS